jgi:hypothetical protein
LPPASNVHCLRLKKQVQQVAIAVQVVVVLPGAVAALQAAVAVLDVVAELQGAVAAPDASRAA